MLRASLSSARLWLRHYSTPWWLSGAIEWSIVCGAPCHSQVLPEDSRDRRTIKGSAFAAFVSGFEQTRMPLLVFCVCCAKPAITLITKDFGRFVARFVQGGTPSQAGCAFRLGF